MALANRWHRLVLVQVVTIVRVPLAILFGCVLLLSDRSLPVLIACAVILLVAELTDLFDGMLARALGVVTEWGAMLDPYADSIGRIIVYWSLAEAKLAHPFTPVAMALRDVTVAYCRIILTRCGRSVSAKWSGKIKAVVQGVAAFVLLLGPTLLGVSEAITQGVSWIVIVVTLASGIEYVAGAVAAVRSNG